MPIIYRKQKGSPLTIEEMDENFAQLERRLHDIETVPSLAEGIKEIKQQGDQLTIFGTHGSVFGPFILPKYLPNPRGSWLTNTRYAFGDWVNYKESLYFCSHGHTSESFEKETHFWTLLLEGNKA